MASMRLSAEKQLKVHAPLHQKEIEQASKGSGISSAIPASLFPPMKVAAMAKTRPASRPHSIFGHRHLRKMRLHVERRNSESCYHGDGWSYKVILLYLVPLYSFLQTIILLLIPRSLPLVLVTIVIPLSCCSFHSFRYPSSLPPSL